MSDYAVSCTDIVKTYPKGNVRALDGVSLNVPRGQVFGLLGPNGSGKTTMVRILATILAPTSGLATVNGFDVVKQAKKVRETIGLAGQYATVDPNLTGYENLYMIGRLNHLEKAVVRQRATELLEQFNLTPIPAECVADSTWPPPWWADHRFCFSMNPPPVSTRRVDKTCGAPLKVWWKRA